MHIEDRQVLLHCRCTHCSYTHGLLVFARHLSRKPHGLNGDAVSDTGQGTVDEDRPAVLAKLAAEP